jgi:hypothetical protein
LVYLPYPSRFEGKYQPQNSLRRRRVQLTVAALVLAQRLCQRAARDSGARLALAALAALTALAALALAALARRRRRGTGIVFALQSCSMAVFAPWSAAVDRRGVAVWAFPALALALLAGDALLLVTARRLRKESSEALRVGDDAAALRRLRVLAVAISLLCVGGAAQLLLRFARDKRDARSWSAGGEENRAVLRLYLCALYVAVAHIAPVAIHAARGPTRVAPALRFAGALSVVPPTSPRGSAPA